MSKVSKIISLLFHRLETIFGSAKNLLALDHGFALEALLVDPLLAVEDVRAVVELEVHVGRVVLQLRHRTHQLHRV